MEASNAPRSARTLAIWARWCCTATRRPAGNRWAAIVDTTIQALIQAEISDVTAANVEALRQSADPQIRRLLGTTPGIGKALGLDDDWAVFVVQAVGNYGEIFQRDIGDQSPLKLERGLNKPWTQGGLLHAQPFR